MTDFTQLPFNIKVEKARNEMRYAVNSICTKYDLPGSVIDLVVESILAEENQQRISLICEQITSIEEEQGDATTKQKEE